MLTIIDHLKLKNRHETDLIKRDEQLARISQKSEYLSFEEKLKNIDTFQKVICSQDLSSISSLISSISVESKTEILKSRLTHEQSNNKHKCITCSKTDSLSLIKLINKDNNLVLSKLSSMDHDDDDEDDDSDSDSDSPGDSSTISELSKLEFAISILLLIFLRY